ncbi:BTB/POZ domain-containing protein 6-like [Mytilus californianus]|uniref:BTB/POZ domain-containing protein 6-like n=1 Tax=Mytilus californianus TaxID=6549 RepID=UPI00224736A2|nr:BTB/POZ domain-containing protein 6-like [Mytilus californianus]
MTCPSKIVKTSYSRDWQDNKSLKECMMYMLKKEIMCDAIFRVGAEQSIVKVHKYMLASRSPVFYTMFEGACPEKGEVIVPDVNLGTFKVLLKYIYSDVLDLSLDNIQEVLYVAEKYMLSAMQNECAVLLSSSVETSNASILYHIQYNAAEFLKAPNAIKMSKECMESILQLDSANCSETDICQFLIKWAGSQCEAEKITPSGENMRKITGSLLYLVRFPLIDKIYFANEIIHSGFLTLEEVVSVFSSHYGQKNEFFAESVRKVCYQKSYRVLRHSYLSNSWMLYRNKENDALQITVNKNIELKSVILYGAVGNVSCNDREIIVKILNDNGNEICNQTYESCTHVCDVQTVVLSEPIPLNSNECFTIMVNSVKFVAYYGNKCKPECRIDDMTEQRRMENWRDGKSLSECMVYMLEREIMYDVTFRVGTEESIFKANKYMLASRSQVFCDMFEGSYPEKGDIKVSDINSATFKVLLK